MRFRSFISNTAVCLAPIVLAPLALAPSEAQAKNYALLIGVTTYDKEYMNDPQLQFPEDDAKALGKLFGNSDYEVDLLLGSNATRRAVSTKIDALGEKGHASGVIVIGLFGHGTQIDQTQYFCPWDTSMRVQRDGQGDPIKDREGKNVMEPDPKSLVKFADLLDGLKNSGAGGCVVLADCCRKPPNAARGRAVGFGKSFKTAELPDKTAVLFACEPEHQAFEHPDWGHGAFTKCLLDEFSSRLKSGKKVKTSSLIDPLQERVHELVAALPDHPSQTPVPFDTGSIDLQLSRGQAPLPASLAAPFEKDDAQTAQTQWAKYLGRPETVSSSIGMKLTLIPPGSFTMGGESVDDLKQAFPNLQNWLAKSPSINDDFAAELPRHKVRITKPFLMGTYHITKRQFADFVSATGYVTDPENGKGGRGVDSEKGLYYDRKFSWNRTGFEYGDDHPVVNVSWNDCVAFCKWLSRKEHKNYRLPTEAEYEYACRAGTSTRYYNGNDPEDLIKIGNVTDATLKGNAYFSSLDTVSGSDNYMFTCPVGQFQPNAFGLHEMLGNVPTWCSDWLDLNYYSRSPSDDPKGPSNGDLKIYRGGGWLCMPWQCRAAFRHSSKPDSCCCCMGFRIAADVDVQP